MWQQKSRMIRRHYGNALIVVKATAQFADRECGLQQIGRRTTAQCNDKFRLHQRKLSIEIFATVRRFACKWRAIARRPALEDVANINLLALETRGLDDLVQELPRRS